VKEINRIKLARLPLAAGVAAIVHFLTTGLVNGVVLSSELHTWLQGAEGLIHPPGQATSMCLWALMSLLFGVIGVWIYAHVRPSYTARISAALLAAVSLWMVSKLAVALDLIALGMMPLRIIAGQTIGGLIAILLGVFAGAWVYGD
jgi:hypothetical protein